MGLIEYRTRLEKLCRIAIDKPLIRSTNLVYILGVEKELRDIAEKNDIKDPVIVPIGGGPYSQVLFNAVCSKKEAQGLRKEAVANHYPISPSYLMWGLDWFDKKKYSLN